MPTSTAKRPRRSVHGVLLVDKPVGPSSTQLLSRLKGLYQAEKAGHGGTLDPLASGLLPILFGEATKFAQVGLEADKSYRATLRLGQTSDTGDALGQLSAAIPVHVSRDQVARVLERFLGGQLQTPPMYSALKHQGKPLYAYARKGQSIERAPRAIRIFQLTLDAFLLPDVTISIRCSKGTYIRSLAESIGQALGCGAHLISLRRTGLASFIETDLVLMDDIESSSSLAQKDQLLRPVDALITGWPQVQLSEGQAKDFLQGRALAWSQHWGCEPLAETIRVRDPMNRFLGVAYAQEGRLNPKRVLSQAAHS